jgi:hypothetical protein
LFFETGSHYITEVGLKLTIILPQPPECWDHTQLGVVLSLVNYNGKMYSEKIGYSEGNYFRKWAELALD